MRIGIAWVVSMGVASVSMGVASIGTAFADGAAGDRARLEEFAPTAPAWAKDCTLDVVELGVDAFSVAVACRGSEELVFERRAMTNREFEQTVHADADELGATLSKLTIATARGAAMGYAAILDGASRVIVRRAPPKGASDIYMCSSTAERDAIGRCKALVEAFAHSTVIRRGAAAFTRPKS